MGKISSSPVVIAFAAKSIYDKKKSLLININKDINPIIKNNNFNDEHPRHYNNIYSLLNIILTINILIIITLFFDH